VVKLAPASGARAGEAERRRSAVLLPAAPDDDEEVLVVMRAGHYMSIQSLSVQLNDTSYILQPAGLIEGGEDFDCARFRMVRA
jgi:8-oxo-dGTP pyrophosphatase MutT (NUDIX family)